MFDQTSKTYVLTDNIVRNSMYLTPAGRELAAKTAKPVYSAEQAALEQLGMAEAEHFVRLGQEHLNAIRTEFNKILQQEKV